MLTRRFNSSWSSVTSLWNRIRGAAKSAEGSTDAVAVTVATAPSTTNTTSSAEVASPWTTVAPLKQEPLREFWIRTGLFRVSAQKLNMLGRQISGLPLSTAILQMQFSPKGAARNVHGLLMQAQSRIKLSPEKADPARFVIQQALVGKGPYLKRLDIKARGRHGIIWHPHTFLRLQLAIPDADAILRKRFKVRIQREDKPAMVRLEY